MRYIQIGAAYCGVLLSTGDIFAEEYTVELEALEQVVKLDSIAMPDKHISIKLSPNVWKAYKIKKVVAHGKLVKKGDVLVKFDSKSIEAKIQELTRTIASEMILLEKAELKLADFKVTAKDKLAEAELKYTRFKETFKHYREVSKPVKISDLDYGVTRAKNNLAYSQEELEQLNKMYEEDGLTEEIIIARVKNSIVTAQRELERTKRNVKYEKEVQILREDLDWETKEVREKRELLLIKKSLPLDLKVKELEVTKMKAGIERIQKELVELKADRELMNLVSPVDGVVYYGEFKDGRWNRNSAERMLRIGESVSSELTILSVVPEDSAFTFCALLTEKQKVELGEKREGNIRLKAKHWINIPATIDSVSNLPLINQKWVVKFTPNETLTKDVIIGSEAEAFVVTTSAENVLSIPKKAVTFKTNGTFSVKLKMADDDPQETAIEIGREGGDKLEIVNGLVNGQVIIIPESRSN